MTATAFSAKISGYNSTPALFFDIYNILTGNYTYTSLSPVVATGSVAPFFTAASSVAPQLSTFQPVLAAYLTSTPVVDNYLTISASQTYNILLTCKVGPSVASSAVSYELTIAYGTANNFSVSSGGDATQVNPLGPVCPIVNLCGAAVVGSNSAGDSMPSFLNAYNLEIALTNRGFALACWNGTAANNAVGNSFLNIQRPVNPSTGLTRTATGTDAPIFSLFRSYTDNGLAVNFEGSGSTEDPAISTEVDYGFWFSTVRSLTIPSSHKPSWTTGNPSVNTSDISLTRPCIYRLAMDWNHPNLFDNFTHVVKFPYGFFTTYHLYLDELDLVCFVNAMAFVTEQPVNITMYGESLERTYLTTYGECEFASSSVAGQGVFTLNRVASTGARLGILTTGKDFV